MRFKRWSRIEPYDDTTRKRAAFHRSQRQKREKLPLFAELIAETQPDVDSVMAQRAIAWVDDQQARRDHMAQLWRRARTRLDSFSANERPVAREMWQRAPYPADPVYLLDMLHGIKVGRMPLDADYFGRHRRANPL